MILQNELYTIVETGDNVARIRLLPECAIYQGHFPGNPVTPGVCQVGIVEELAGMICGFGFSPEKSGEVSMWLMKPIGVSFSRPAVAGKSP